jgi:hypothetical protein
VSLSSAFLPLERFAADQRCDASSARGRCLDATVQRAREASRVGVAQRVVFVRWEVRGDPDFLEHWALELEDGQVLDMTAAQVDGDPRVLRRVTDYPANYVRPRRYPVHSLVGILADPDRPAGWHYPVRRLWSLHRRLFRHDTAAALRSLSVTELFAATRALARAALGLLLHAALECATRRLARLQSRRLR